MKKVNGFDTAKYQERLRLLREIEGGDNQSDFAKRLGIPFKRWSNYERGYPVPRETAFIICDKIRGMSVEWIWWGWTGNLSEAMKAKIAAAERHTQEVLAAERAVRDATAKLRAVSDRRKKATRPASRR